MRRFAVNHNQDLTSTPFDQKRIDPIINALLNVSGSHITLMCHKNADPDSFGSAYALTQFFKQHKAINCTILAESLNKPAVKQVDFLKSEVTQEIDTNTTNFVILDANNLEQLGTIVTESLQETLKEHPPIIIDHHAPHPAGAKLTKNYFVLDDVTSTCEIIYWLLKFSKTEISPDVAFALLTGMIYDTKHFILASRSTFIAASDILTRGVTYQDALSTLNVPPSFSERMARLKSIQRMNLERIGDHLITTSHISAYEASTARTLVNIGADIAIVWKSQQDELRISGRCTNKFYTETGIHLGKLFEQAAEIMGGVGGGHRTAAGLNADSESDSSVVIRLIRDILENQTKGNEKSD